MVVLALAALLAAAPLQPSQDIPAAQDPPAAQASADPGAVDLGDVEVTGRPLDSLIRDFVGEVAEPNRRRSLARWDQEICVGVANLRNEPAQYIADRISTVASDLNLQAGAPGCTPNLLVVATEDGTEMARLLVEERRRAFRMGGSGMDRGGDALEDFRDTDRPVRWWQMSLPVDSETGLRATRIPGECQDPCQSPSDYAPQIAVFAASRLKTQIVDNIIRTIVIVDVDQVSHLSIQQLADFIAMVSLAQIDPDADTRAYASILNLFHDPDGNLGLTAWDRAYLGGLYDAERTDANRRANLTEVARSIRRAHDQIRAGEDGAVTE
ncbi:hypothetical protein N0B44_19080 [Roseibacterium beibuensis]|uniref:hypothetical protein n=1 Tax=[Roseibacterium] beibuensis TaxID=1193142 RepID=UPI00217D7E34|nr:hypothetical protein [Roseibacterium beibuensis]MCS6625021.1 hypothetical protein [Roseibacterium beibuensis]